MSSSRSSASTAGDRPECFRAVNSSSLRSPAHWWLSPTSCFSTSRRSVSRHHWWTTFSPPSGISARAASPSSSSSSVRNGRSRSPTARTYSRTASSASPSAPPTPATRRRWSPPTSQDDRHALRRRRRADPGRRCRSRCRLCPDGGRNRARLRRPPPRQLRVRPARHGRRLHARVHGPLARRLEHRRLLRRRRRPLARHGQGRVPAPEARLARCDARRHLRDRLHAPGDRAARGHPRQHDRRDRNLDRAAEPADHHPRRRRPQDHDRRGRGRRCRPWAACAPAHADDDRAPHARRGHRLRDRPAARRAGQPRDRLRRPALRDPGWDRRGDPNGAVPLRRARLRVAGHDRGARGGRRRGHRDRLHDRGDLRRAADRADGVPAVRRVRARDPCAADPACRAVRVGERPGGTRVRRLVDLQQVIAPAILVVAVGIGSTYVSSSNEIYFLNALVSVAIVVAIYVFIGNSGVLSVGQMSFVAVGAFLAGIMTIPLESKSGVLRELVPTLRDLTVEILDSRPITAAAGGLFALGVGLPLMRLSGLAAGIATFAVLEVTHNILREWTKIGPGATTLSLVPETTDAVQATVGALVVVAAALVYQRSRLGRRLRASREDPAAARGVGVNVHRERLWAFVVSGALAGLAGAMLVHLLGSITTEQVYLELTFLTLAMLVVGGLTSLWGAVVGALAVSALDSFLIEAEQGVDVGISLDLPQGTRLIFLGAIMALMLILRPSGLTGGREFRLVR